MLTVAMFHPQTLAGVQRTVPALDAAEAVHKLFDKFPPRPGHHVEVRRDGRLIGQWFVSKGAHGNPMHDPVPGVIMEGHTANFANRAQWAMREDGQWFVRYQDRTPRGYRWGAWRRGGWPSDTARPSSRRARLPK